MRRIKQQTQKWPDRLWVVRHGQSAGNVARDEAEARGLHEVALATREMDVPLSPLGERQAAALGRWFARMPKGERPDAVLTSPYLRARRTAEIVVETAGLGGAEADFVTDERLREKEFGIFDRLTKEGAREKYPEHASYRDALGKFYHRPPGGESWCDVILRLRSAVGTITREHRGARVLVVCHSVTVFCLRYLLERMTEHEILDLDHRYDAANCGVTAYEYDEASRRLALRHFNFVAPLEEEGAPVTASKDVPLSPK